MTPVTAKAPRRSKAYSAEALLAAIVESSADAIVSTDLSSVVSSWNRGAEAMFGFSAAEMIGSSILRLIPASRHPEEVALVERIQRGETMENAETERLTKEGRLLEISVTASPIRDPSGTIIGVSKIARDITTTKERERELARVSRLHAALSAINHAIVQAKSRDELFQSICTALVKQECFPLAWIGLHDPVSRRITPVATAGDEADYIRSITISSEDRMEGRGPTGNAFRSERPYICNNLDTDPGTLPWRAEINRRGFRASAVFLIRMQGKASGTLSVYAAEPGYFRDKEIALLQEAAAEISFGLDNLARVEARQQAEQNAKAERAFSEAILNSLPGVLYLYDENLNFLRWNHGFERATGYTTEEIANLSPLDLFTSDERPIVAARIKKVFDLGESSVEAVLQTKEGLKKPYYFTGVVTEFEGQRCVVGVGIDIGAQRQAEAARRTSQAGYQVLFDQAPDGILIADRANAYTNANDTICRMLGYSREELIGLKAADIVAPAELPNLPIALEKVKRGEMAHREWKFRRKNGSLFPAEAISTMLPDGTLMAMVRDITERKRAEIALREANESLELRVADRTADLRVAVERAETADRIKSAFLATMSHELRTPLNSIIGFTGIILQGLAGPLNPEQTKQLGMVRGSARHLLELINDVLDISKIEAEQLKIVSSPYDLRDSLANVVASVRPLAEKKGLELTCSFSPDLGTVTGDRRRLEQIVINLLNNAIKFTERGRVSLTAEPHANYLSSPKNPGVPAFQLEVQDSGIGIKPADLQNLFQPFRQIDTGLSRQHEGTGLGLAICRRLATLMGGEISAASEWTRGSKFTLIIPLGKRPTP